MNKVFNETGVFFNQPEFFNEKFVREHMREYKKVYSLLDDELSRNFHIAILNTRMNGDSSYLFLFIDKNSTYFNNDLYKVSDHEVVLGSDKYSIVSDRVFERDKSRL